MTRSALDNWHPLGREAWAAWRPSTPLTIGVEEEVMLLDPRDWSLAQRIDDLLPRLPTDLPGRVSAETHRGAIELITDPRPTVDAALAQLAELRARLAAELEPLGVALATSGTHPCAVWSEIQLSAAPRPQLVGRSMRELARREPTFALHVHVGVQDAATAVLLMNRLRAHLPLLLALSANSPFWQGRDTGLASIRTSLFQAFPRTGIPRRFASYEDWSTTLAILIDSGAITDPTFLWWDIRLQPRLGTVEVRIMDAQTSLETVAALCALVQAVARLELDERFAAPALVAGDEVLAENRFLAARDGIEARLVDPDAKRRRPARLALAELLSAARPHAERLGCREHLERVVALSDGPGFAWQRSIVARGHGLSDLVATMAGSFAPPHACP